MEDQYNVITNEALDELFGLLCLSEIQAYIEARRRQFAFKTVAAWNTSDPMDGASFGKGGKKGKKGKKGGKGHNQSQNPNPSKDVGCWHSGKKSHLRTECWSNPQKSDWLQSQNKGGKGKAKEWALWNKETKLHWSTPATDSCDLSGLGIVGNSWQITALGPRRLVEMDIRHGCGDFPPDEKIGTETQANECSYKTASGELTSDRGRLPVQGTTEYGYGLTCQGRKADVHKTLISACKVHSEGHVAVVNSNGGFIIPNRHLREICNNSFKMRL